MRRPPNFLSPAQKRPPLTGWTAIWAAMILTGGLAALPATAQNAQLRVVVVDGTQATNNIENGRMADVVVQVQDANRMPVAGASVSFVYPPSGPSGVFPNGERARTVTTGADGHATASGVSPEGGPGQFEIRISASYQGQTATAVVNQTNISVPLPQSAKPSSASSGGPSSGASRKKKIWIVVAIAAGAAAGGIATALASGGNGGSSTPSTPTIVLTPGTPTVGGP